MDLKEKQSIQRSGIQRTKSNIKKKAIVQLVEGDSIDFIITYYAN